MPQRLCARQEHPAENESMRCVSAEHADADDYTSKESYEEASETVEELEREIEHLKSKVASLRSWSTTDRHHHLSGPGSADVVLVAAEDGNGGPSMPVPAGRAVLVSIDLVAGFVFRFEFGGFSLLLLCYPFKFKIFICLFSVLPLNLTFFSVLRLN